MASRVMELFAERLPLISTVVIVSILAIAIQRLVHGDPLAKFPHVGAEVGNAEKRRAHYRSGAKDLYQEGYRKFKDTVFRLTSVKNSRIVVVPPRFLPELKSLPDDTLSFAAAIDESMEVKYTKLRSDQPFIVHSVKTSLTPALVRLNPTLAEEVDRTLRAEFPSAKDWTEVNVYSKLLRIVAIVSGRIFIGPELCHDEEYIDAAVNYTTDLMKARGAIQYLPPWIRWLMAPRLPQVKRLAEREEQARAFLQPVVAARRKAEREQPGYQKPDDMLQWFIDSLKKFGNREDRELAKAQLGLSFAAIHTTTLTTTNALYNLAVHPELAAELREEVRAVLGDSNNVFTSHALQNMKKMDSFLKETLRVHPPSFAAFGRKVLKPFTLSNGQVIPAGVTIEIPSYAISRDDQTFPDPETFDGLRFYKLRQMGETFNHPAASGEKSSAAVESAAHNQFVSVSPNSLTFGYGRHACPGRFFAANEIKMILARTLLEWDIKNVGDSQERYPNLEFSNTSIPDPKRNLLFREAQD